MNGSPERSFVRVTRLGSGVLSGGEGVRDRLLRVFETKVLNKSVQGKEIGEPLRHLDSYGGLLAFLSLELCEG